MGIDADKLLADALRDGFREAVKYKMQQGYDNPIIKMVAAAIEEHGPALRSLLADSVGALLGDEAFRQEVAASVRSQLAKQVVHKFGGELEKQVNLLKSDPATRARITLAIEEIIKERTSAAPA